MYFSRQAIKPVCRENLTRGVTLNYLIELITNEINLLTSLEYNILIIISIICLAVLALRIILTSVYSGHRGLFKLNAKEIKLKADIKNTRHPLLNKIIKDFQRVLEKNITNIDISAIVKRHVNGLNFIGFNYTALAKFVTDFEIGVIFFGLIFAIISERPYLFILLSVVAFILFRFFSMLFDFKTHRENLVFDMQNYIEAEIGQFYVTDLASSVNSLKHELSLSIENIASNVESVFSKNLDEPFEKWKNAIEHAYDAQNQINAAAFELSSVVNDFNNDLTELIKYSKEQNEIIKLSTKSIVNEYENIKTLNNALKIQLSFIEEKQEMFERVISDYEHSLKLFTKDTALAFVSTAEHGVKRAYDKLNKEFKENIEAISFKNIEALKRLETLVGDFDNKIDFNRGE